MTMFISKTLPVAAIALTLACASGYAGTYFPNGLSRNGANLNGFNNGYNNGWANGQTAGTDSHALRVIGIELPR
jgi:hypothetical protein